MERLMVSGRCLRLCRWDDSESDLAADLRSRENDRIQWMRIPRNLRYVALYIEWERANAHGRGLGKERGRGKPPGPS